MNPLVSIVVAMNIDRIIGIDNQLPWHISEDLKHFKDVTMGKPIIMGRKTLESIGRILPGRKNIIISRSSKEDLLNKLSDSYLDIKSEVEVYSSINKAISDNVDYPELCIIGGGKIFEAALHLVNKIYLTIVDVPIANNLELMRTSNVTFFPEFNINDWKIVKDKSVITLDGIKCEFKELIKIED